MGKRAVPALAVLIVCPLLALPSPSMGNQLRRALRAHAAQAGVHFVPADGQPLDPRYQQWANNATVPTFRGDITLHPNGVDPTAAKLGSLAQTDWNGQNISLQPGVGRSQLYYELGAVFDKRLMNDGERSTFRKILGFKPDAQWKVTSYKPNDSFQQVARPMTEMFEAAYALAAQRRKLKPTSLNSKGVWGYGGARQQTFSNPYGLHVTQQQFARIRRLIGQVAARNGY